MKISKILLIIVLVIVLIPVLGFLSWQLKKGHELDIVFINKSMTHFDGTENKSFNWILNNKKILGPGKALYDMEFNYYGLHLDGDEPRNEYPRLKDLDRLVEKADLVYYADISGIPASKLGMLREGEDDEPQFGGFNNTDYVLSKKAIASGTKFIAECNFYGYPTEPLMRYNIEQITDIYCLGWIGRYTEDLSRNSRHRINFDYVDIYEKDQGHSWDFSGPGLILVDKSKARVLVLREGLDINISDGFISASDEAVSRFKLPDITSYDGWFSMLHPGKNNVLCTFNLNPTVEGKTQLKANGLPDSFPALIEHNENFYFLAGDFGKTEVRGAWSRVYGLNNIIDAVKSRGYDKPSNFFYTFYKPLMSGILEETISEAERNND
jgi:hypothetical protein